MTDLAGKTAIVTGSTSGLGLGLARGFATAGANVVLNGFGTAMRSRRRAGLDGLGAGTVVYDGADMTTPDEIEALVKGAAERFGRVDIVVNNAGIPTISPSEDFPKDRWDMIIDINMNSGTVRATRLDAGQGAR